ncbi:hypothetical protein IIC65_04310 [Candidatus Sumerlaeota bacterium]|nr:hypothetical protein [Candidatus Sumerlaeota bacterium]
MKIAPMLALTMTGLLLMGCDAAAHYRKYGDGKSLDKALHTRIKKGESIARVQDLLGPGLPARDPERHRDLVRRFIERDSESFPDGVSDDDFFLAYRMGAKATKILQFRDDKLINFDPAHYAKGQRVNPVVGP